MSLLISPTLGLLVARQRHSSGSEQASLPVPCQLGYHLPLQLHRSVRQVRRDQLQDSRVLPFGQVKTGCHEPLSDILCQIGHVLQYGIAVPDKTLDFVGPDSIHYFHNSLIRWVAKTCFNLQQYKVSA